MKNHGRFSVHKHGRANAGRMAAAGAAILAPLAALAIAGCGQNGASYSLLPSASDFSQSSATVNNKLDVLWVVDNSGSMDPLQQNLANNFQSFISTFQTKGFDFQIAVTTSDAYLAAPSYDNDPARAKFRDDGSGLSLLLPATAGLLQAFMNAALQGSGGSGDERVFQSLTAALTSPLNAGFPRPGAFLAIVILSDEDDFTDYNRAEGSWVYGGVADHSYTNPGLVTVDSVVAGLDSLTGSAASSRRYNVSAITVLDNACLTQHAAATAATIIGARYIELANKTNGVLGSVCDPSYANSLTFIQQRIVELSTAFRLDRIPVVSSLQVFVNGASASLDASNGWTYDASMNAIVFHGAGVPPANASIRVAFDPVSIQ